MELHTKTKRLTSKHLETRKVTLRAGAFGLTCLGALLTNPCLAIDQNSAAIPSAESASLSTSNKEDKSEQGDQHSAMNNHSLAKESIQSNTNINKLSAPGDYSWEKHNFTIQLDLNSQQQQWNKLHQEDRYTFPSASAIEQRLDAEPELIKQVPEGADSNSISQALQHAWLAFHRGDFEQAYREGMALGHFGLLVSSNAAYLNAFYREAPTEQRQQLFKGLADTLSEAITREPDNQDLNFMYCYMIGRYLEELPFKTSLVGSYSRMFSKLNTLIEQNPEHLGARLLLAGFHAEGSVKAGFLSRVRFGSSAKKAKKQFQSTLEAYPQTIIGQLNYALSLQKINKGELDQEALAALIKANKMPVYDANSTLAQEQVSSLLSRATL